MPIPSSQQVLEALSTITDPDLGRDVVTLGMMSVYRGLTLLLIGEMYIHDIPDGFRAPFQSAPLGIPAAAWLAVSSESAACRQPCGSRWHP